MAERTDRELLIRIDERQQAMAADLKEIKTEMIVDLKDLKTELMVDIKELRTELKDGYVTKNEFIPVSRGAYAALGLFMTSVVGFVLTSFTTLFK